MLPRAWAVRCDRGLRGARRVLGGCQFNRERVESGIKRLKAARLSSSQQRLDSFFTVSGISSSTNKRKEEPAKPAKGGKAGGGGGSSAASAAKKGKFKK